MSYRLLALRRSLGLVAFGIAAVASLACTSPLSVGGEGGSGDSSTGEGASSGAGGGATGGISGTGGTGTGGFTGTGGAKGGTTGTGGTGTGGAKGGTKGTGGTTGSGRLVEHLHSREPPERRYVHTTTNASGTADGLSWSLWTNGSGGTITTFSVPAFSAAWNSSGDFLARLGLQWGSGKAYTSLGTVTAQFAETKSGSGGNYSYIGIYGWSVNPCIEFYIVDDSYNTMPVNPGSTTLEGTVTLMGAPYNLYLRNTTGTGGNRCGTSSRVGSSFTVSGRRLARAGKYPLATTSRRGPPPTR